MKVSINLSEIAGSYTTNTNYRVAIDEGFVLDSISKIPNAANPTLGSITSFNNLPITTIGYQTYPVVSNTTRTPTKTITATNRAIVFEPVVPKTVNLYDVTTATAVLKASIPTTSTLVSYVINNNINFDLYDYIYPNKSYRLDLPSGVCKDLMNFESVSTSSNFTVGSYVSLPPTKYMTYPVPEFEIRPFPYPNRGIVASDNYYAILEEAVIVDGYTYTHTGKYHIYRMSDDSYVRSIQNTNSQTSNTTYYGSGISNQYIAINNRTSVADDNGFKVEVRDIQTGSLVRNFNIATTGVFISGDRILFVDSALNPSKTHVYSISTGSLLYTSTAGAVIAVSNNYATVAVSGVVRIINITNGAVVYDISPPSGQTYGRPTNCQMTDSYTIYNISDYNNTRYAFVFSNITGLELHRKYYQDALIWGIPYYNAIYSTAFMSGLSIDNDYFLIANLNGTYVEGGFFSSESRYGNSAGFVEIYSMSTGNLVAKIDNPVINPNQLWPGFFGAQTFLKNKKLLASSYVEGNSSKRNLYSFNLNRLKA